MSVFDSIEPIEGGSIERGRPYHDLPFDDLVNQNSFRVSTKQRMQFITNGYSVDGKYGFDLGCAVGGMSFAALQQGASSMTGYDYDQTSIDLANSIADERNLDADFKYAFMNAEWLASEIGMWAPDFVMWLSNYMWIVKQDGQLAADAMLQVCADTEVDLIFESAQHSKDAAAGKFTEFAQASDIREHLETFYGDGVMDLGPSPTGWNSRNVFICRS